ncbi:hypothetical protein SDC9_169587 [bioreactor metagenome]|uniref:Uncharacterized protein n=1 Tax=bioreactor metagenome TaxID=1076179 RepID=A0A645GDX1_9ZZZZ
MQQLHVGQVDPCIGADVHGVPLALGVVDELLGKFPCADRCRVVFRIHGVDSHGRQQFLWGNGGCPRHRLAIPLCLQSIRIVLVKQFAQQLL